MKTTDLKIKTGYSETATFTLKAGTIVMVEEWGGRVRRAKVEALDEKDGRELVTLVCERTGANEGWAYVSQIESVMGKMKLSSGRVARTWYPVSR